MKCVEYEMQAELSRVCYGRRVLRLGIRRSRYTRRYRQLTDMTHRVFRTMHKAPDHRRRELCTSDRAKVAQCRDIYRAKLGDRRVDAR